jgi:CBS domain-containing protein
MQTIKVKDMMVRIEEYATVSEDANLYQAVLALEDAQKRFAQDRYKHRAVLVYDKSKNVVGKLSQLDVIMGLETGYKKIGDLRGVEHSGFSSELIRSMIQRYSLWQQPLDDICRRAPHIKIKDIMYTPTEGEYVDEEATLDQAIHQLVIGRHQSLLVTKDSKIVGILRLTDVFVEICEVIKTCQL